MPPIEIRALARGDHAAWLTLWAGYQEFYQADIAPVTETTWQRLLDPAEPMHGALAWHGGDQVGLVHWIMHRSTWSIGDVCYLQDLYVAPDHRKSGIGRRLIEHACDAAIAAGCPEIYWLTHDRNYTAMKLYDRIATRSSFVQYQKIL